MCLLLALLSLTPTAPTPPELGVVAWQRDYDAARREAEHTGKPILILFDEVPGCSTCVRYGRSVLSHPLVADAVEESFVPVAIYNNRGGRDREVLRHFGEPSWNNPVVRFVDAQGRQLAPRLANDYQRASLVARMELALSKLGRSLPSYLTEDTNPTDRVASYAMGCFWSGEACLGAIPGVRSTRTGFAAGREVVQLRYDPEAISTEELHAAALKRGCSRHAVVKDQNEARLARPFFPEVTVSTRFRGSPKDDKHALRRSLARFLPLTESQATRINARIATGQDFGELLSPSQQSLWSAIRRHPGAAWKVPGQDLASAMLAAEAVALTP